MYKSQYARVWSSLGICPRVGWPGHMTVLFVCFWGTSALIFIMTSLICTPNQQWVGVPFSPYPPQRFLLVFLMTAILTRVRDYLKVVLICLSPLTKDVDHFPKQFLESVFLLSKTACSFPQFTCRLAVLLPWHLIPAAPCHFWILAPVCRWSGFSPISWALWVPWC